MLEKGTVTDTRYAENGVSLANMSMNDRIGSAEAKALYSTAGSQVISYGSYWWPQYNWTVREVRNSFEDAFKIVSMLIEKGYLKNVRLKDFIRIVKEVESEL